MADLTEGQYLSTQADDAAKAIAKTAAALKADIGNTINPIGWAKEYPWISVGAAAVAGFAAASMAVPSKEDQALKRMERIERALMPDPVMHRGAKEGAEPKAEGPSVFTHILKIVQPALSSIVAAYSAQHGAQGQGGEESQNGNGQAASAANVP